MQARKLPGIRSNSKALCPLTGSLGNVCSLSILGECRACNSASRFGPESNEETVTVVDSLGNEATIPKQVNKVSSMRSGITEIICALGQKDKIVAVEEGYIFRGPSSGARPLYRVPKYDRALPLYTSLGTVEAITDVAGLTLQALERERVALILVEGVGCKSFPLSFQPISNTLHWHTYSAGDSQYLALTTGKLFVEHPYPPGYRYYVDDGEDKAYPFSAIFAEMPPDTIGRRFAGRSAAVGGRGILTHAVAGVDIAIECFVRALYNHGVMAVLDVCKHDIESLQTHYPTV